MYQTSIKPYPVLFRQKVHECPRAWISAQSQPLIKPLYSKCKYKKSQMKTATINILITLDVSTEHIAKQ